MNKILSIFFITCSVFVNDCMSQIIVEFQDNEKYFVKVDGEEYTFNGLGEFYRGFKDISSKYIDYTHITIEDNKTIIFDDFMFNKNGFSLIDKKRNIYGKFILKSDWRFQKDIILNYKDNEDIYLPEITLNNIESLEINSKHNYIPKSGKLDCNDLEKISINKVSFKEIQYLTTNLSITGRDSDLLPNLVVEAAGLLAIFAIEKIFKPKPKNYCNIF